jgi:hypothetical protein
MIKFVSKTVGGLVDENLGTFKLIKSRLTSPPLPVSTLSVDVGTLSFPLAMSQQTSLESLRSSEYNMGREQCQVELVL